uniref:Uncharacterized protein n=1 Tax=viral metagenome TaxID=1070528 RepID=A0A6M3JV06_9ZZZZ
MADDQIGVGLMGWLRDVKARVVEIDNDGGAKFKGGVGFNGTAPVGQATAYTQTFSSAGRTVVAPSGGAIATTAAVVATGAAVFGLAG